MFTSDLTESKLVICLTSDRHDPVSEHMSTHNLLLTTQLSISNSCDNVLCDLFVPVELFRHSSEN